MLNDATIDHELKITIAKYDFPYEFSELSTLIDEVEDFLLDHRNIKIDPFFVDSIKRYLYEAKYTPAQYSLAKLWIEKGAWPQSKRQIEISDFYPKTSQLEFAYMHLLTKEFAYRKFNALRTDYEIGFTRKFEEWKEKNADQTAVQLEKELKIKEMQFIQLRLETNIKIDELNKKITMLHKENEKLKANILRNNQVL